MKSKFLLLPAVCVLMSGCGVDWFPAVSSTSSSSTNTDNSTLTAPTVRAALSPTSIANGDSSTLTLTILNKAGNPAQTGLAFVEAIPTGFTAKVASAPSCGTLEATSSSLIFSNGVLATGTSSCTMTATLTAGATAQTVVIKPADFTLLQGGLTNGVTDQTLTVTTPAPTAGATLSATISPVAVLDGGDSTITFVINKASATPALTAIGFLEQLPSGLTARIDTNSANTCGGTVTTPTSGSQILLSNGAIPSGTLNCSMTATLTAKLSDPTTEQPFGILATDFTNLAPSGSLTNGVTGLNLKAFPLTVSSGVVTVSGLLVHSFSDNGAGPFTFEIDTFNNSPTNSNVTATITVVALDKATGAEIPSTLTTGSNLVISPQQSLQKPLTSTSTTVPAADVQNIALWRLKSVTVQ